MVSKLWICAAMVLVALTVVACGSKKPAAKNEQAAQATETATPTPSPTPTEEPDTDGDGTVDFEDFDPKNPKIQEAADAEKCDVLGINAKRGKEGACTADNGTKLKIVNRDTVLTLPQMNVRLVNITSTNEIPRPYDSPLVGSFVVAQVEITNKLNSPVETNAPDQFSLLLNGKEFSPNFDAMNEGADDGLVYEELQPDETTSGAVVFRVAAKHAPALAKNGNLFVLQFSDVGEYGRAKHRIGVIRTYR